jgi:predicted DNA-binding protein
MTTITARIPDELDKSLSMLAQETERNKAYIIRKAIENYIEEKADILIALSRIEKNEKTISIEEIKKKYVLED